MSPLARVICIVLGALIYAMVLIPLVDTFQSSRLASRLRAIPGIPGLAVYLLVVTSLVTVMFAPAYFLLHLL
jgi:hypothetical protein